MFFVLTAVVIVVYMLLFPPPRRPIAPKPPSIEEAQEPSAAEDQAETAPMAVWEPAETVAALPEPEMVEEFEEALEVEVSEKLSNGLAVFEFSNRGGILKRIVLIPDQVVLHKEVDLFYGEMQADEYPFAISSEEDKRFDLAQFPFELVSKDKLNLVYTCKRGNLQITKEYRIVPDDYVVEAKITFENTTAEKIAVEGYTLGAGAIFPIRPIDPRPAYRYVISDNDKPTKIKGKPGTSFTRNPADMKWAAVTNRYFSIITKPIGQNIAQVTGGGEKIVGYTFKKNSKKNEHNYYPLRLRVEPFKIPPRNARSHKFSFYFGPKDFGRLKKLGFEQVDAGWLSFIEKPMLKFLKWCYKIVPNYGVAIILLTVLIKLVLYPLDQKSYKSMKEMQRIQPLVAELRIKHKDDQRKLQQETMKLYKEHHVNPFGGCLPLVLQMPILFAMFKMLQGAVELWGAPFVFWIRDLSQPDSLIMFRK